MSQNLARFYRVHRVEVLDDLVRWVGRFREEEPELFRSYGWDFSGVREFEQRREYVRLERPARPVLVARRPGEERRTSRRYPNPYANMPRLLTPPSKGRALAIAAE